MTQKEMIPDRIHLMSGALVRTTTVLQPQLLRSGMGFELLTRVRDFATHVPIEPEFFFHARHPVPELMRLLEQQITTACACMRTWDERGYFVSIAVNVPPTVVLESDELPQIVARVLHRAKIDAARLVLEIVEFPLVAFDDFLRELFSKRIAALRDIGVRISLDDCGTGNNMKTMLLHLLSRELVNEIKVCRRTLSPAEVRFYTDLAHQYRCFVIIEGIENRKQASEAIRIGGAQGSFIGAPLVPSAVLNWMETTDIGRL